MQRILIIDRAIPTPDWSGASARLLNIIKAFRSLGLEIDLIVRDPHELNRVPEILDPIGVYSIHNIRATSKKINKIVKNSSLIWLSFFDIAEEYLPIIRKLSKVPIVIDTVDVHSLRLSRQAKVQSNDEVLKYAKEVKKREIEIYSQANLLIGVTNTDCEELKKIVPNVPSKLISNIYAPCPIPQKKNNKRNGILFIGNSTHPPNMDALELICKEIFPNVLKKLPNANLKIIGFGTNNLPFKLPKNTEALGRIENVIPEIQSAVCSIAPIRFGAGIKGKVVESMFYGTPVVATKAAIEGMNVQHLNEIMIASNWKEFVEQIYTLHSDFDIWKNIKENGIKATKEKYGLNKCRNTLIQILSQHNINF